MKNKIPLKILTDLVMTILFITLIDAYGTGLPFHEVAGLAIFGVFAFHLLLNGSWVVKVGQNLLNPKIKMKTKLMYFLNFSQFVSIVIIIVTGILISQVVFPSSSSGDNSNLIAIHKLTSYGSLGLFAVHIALHWKYIINAVRNMYRNSAGSIGLRTIKAIGALVMVIGIIYNLITPDSDKVFAQSASSSQSITDIRRSDPRRNYESRQYSSNNSASSRSQDNVSIDNSQNSTQDSTSLSDFLGNMHCTVCGKHCSLLAPRCGKGNAQVAAAKAQYQSQYGSASTTAQ